MILSFQYLYIFTYLFVVAHMTVVGQNEMVVVVGQNQVVVVVVATLLYLFPWQYFNSYLKNIALIIKIHFLLVVIHEIDVN